MPRYFVTDAPVAVLEFDPAKTISDVPPNAIYIKARMDVETKGKVTSEMVTLGADQKSLEFRAGANETALLVHNIVGWEGPDFAGVACTPENIRKLDPTEPHVARVLEEIALRNRAKAGPSPKSPGASTSMSAGAHGSNASPAVPASQALQLATGIPRSPLQSALDGRLTRSDASIPTTSTNSSHD